MPRASAWTAWLGALAALPALMPNAYAHYVLNLSLILAFATIGLNIIFGYAGQHAFGFPVFFGVGAYASALLAVDAGWPVGLSMLAGSLTTAAISAVIGFPSFRLRGIYFGVGTIAYAYVLYIVAQNWVELTRGPMGIPSVPALRILSFEGVLGLGRDTQVRIAAIVFIGLAIWVLDRLLRSPTGRAWTAIRENENLAASLGIPPLRYQMGAFVLGAGICGLGGGFYAHYVGFVSPTELGFHYIGVIFIMLIAGGVGTLAGPVVGAVVFGVLPEVLRVAEMARNLLLGVILLFCIALLPDGLAGLWRRLRAVRSRGSLRQSSGRSVAPSRDGSGPSSVLPDAIAPPVTAIGSLEISGLCKRFDGLAALSEISFSVPPQQVVGLIGPNGAGKTTLFNIITGFLEPTSGSVRYCGRAIGGRPPHVIAALGVTRTYQITSLFPDLTVAENVQTATHLWALRNPLSALWRSRRFCESEAAIARAVEDRLALVGLAAYRDTQAASLSYGDQRRLEVALALATGARLLLLDEPAAGLNAAETDELCALVRRLKAAGFTVIVIEHDMRMVMSLCDRIVVLNHGALIFDGTPQAAVTDPAVVDAYLGTGTADA